MVNCSAQIIVKEGDIGAANRTFACNFAAFKVANGVPEWVQFRVDDVVGIVEL